MIEFIRKLYTYWKEIGESIKSSREAEPNLWE